MIYIIGSEGFLGKKITKIFDKKKLIKISTKKGKKFIKTDIFSNIKRKKTEKWIRKIKENDIILLLRTQ